MRKWEEHYRGSGRKVLGEMCEGRGKERNGRRFERGREGLKGDGRGENNVWFEVGGVCGRVLEEVEMGHGTGVR